MSAGGRGEHRRTGRPTSRRNAPAPRRHRSGRRGDGARSPRSISARRSVGGGKPAARAIASAITPSSAPWRSSPESSARRKRCSRRWRSANSSAQRGRRAAWEPGPQRADRSEGGRRPRPRSARARRPARGSPAARPSRRRSGAGAARRTGTRRRARPRPGEARRSASASGSTSRAARVVAATVSATAARSASSTPTSSQPRAHGVRPERHP